MFAVQVGRFTDCRMNAWQLVLLFKLNDKIITASFESESFDSDFTILFDEIHNERDFIHDGKQELNFEF